jgi:NADH dehydrogenase
MAKNNKKVLILGGTGFLGYYVIRALDEAGFDIAVLLHKKKDDFDIPFEGYEIFEGDILKPDTLQGVVDRFAPDVVVDMVGSLTKKPGQTPESLLVEGTHNVVKAAQKGGVKKLIYISELGTGQDIRNAYFRARKSAEDIIKDGNIPWTIFRPATMFGWRSGLTNGIVRQIKSALPIPVVRKNLRLLAAETLSKAITDSIEQEKGNGKIYEVAGPEELPYVEIVNRLKMRVNSERRGVFVPKWFVKFFGFGMNKAQKHVIFSSYTKGNFESFKRDFPGVKQIAFDAAGEHLLY